MDGGRQLVFDRSFQRVLIDTLNALSDEQLDVVNRLDVRAYLRRRLNHDFREYVVLEVVSPQLAFAALQQDLGAGPWLTTSIAIFELADGETALAVAEPLGGFAGRPDWRLAHPRLAAIADRACEPIARALCRLEGARRATAAVAAR